MCVIFNVIVLGLCKVIVNVWGYRGADEEVCRIIVFDGSLGNSLVSY